MSLQGYDSLLKKKDKDRISMPFSLAEIQELDVKALMNEKPKARYQAIIHAADDRVEHPVKRTWLNMSMHFNMGIELCGEVVSVFQVLPTGVDSTEVRYSMFGRKNRSKYEQELIELNYKIINQVNSEDKFLTERIQRGAKTQGYKPGALHYQEDTIALNHNNLRALFPVASLAEAPKWGTLAEQNENMLKHQ